MSIGLFINALLVSAAVILILNTVGLVFQGTFAAYLLAMSLVLANSFAVFVRLLVVALPRTWSRRYTGSNNVLNTDAGRTPGAGWHETLVFGSTACWTAFETSVRTRGVKPARQRL